MSNPTLTLLTGSRNTSSWSLRAWLALRLSGLDFQETVFDLRGPERNRISSASPSGMVPCLIVPHVGQSDLVIWDSLAICEYLAEIAPDARLWPTDSRARAWARSVTSEMHSGFADLRRTCPMDIVRKVSNHILTPETQSQVERIIKIWSDCRSASHAAGDYLFGPFGIVDCFYAPVVTRFHTYGIKLNGAAADYSDAVRAWAGMQEWARYATVEETSRAA